MKTRTVDLGVPVHHVDVGEGDVTFVLVHGLGGSHLNWSPIIEPLSQRGRVLVPDLGGFGRTPPSAKGASVDANQALLTRFIDATSPDRPVVLIGNSMGGLLSLRVAAERPAKVRALVLVDAAAPVPLGSKIDPVFTAVFASYMVPGLAEVMMRRRSAKLGAERMVRDMMKLCTVDIARVDPGVIDAHVAMARERQGMTWALDTFLEAARSVGAAMVRRGAYYAAVDAVRAPTLMVHGARDRLVPVKAAQELARRRPEWRYVEHHDLGHTPQLESPAWLMGEINAWLPEALSR